jgi:hypothetical protein
MKYTNKLAAWLTTGIIGVFLIAEPVMHIKELSFHGKNVIPFAVTIPNVDHTPHQEYPMREPVGRQIVTMTTSVALNTAYGIYEIVEQHIS